MAAEPALTTRARAKVNLDLKVLGRRPDGYHELESLVAFAGVGDLLTLDPASELSLTITGLCGAGLDAGEGNLVLRAAKLLGEEIGPLRQGRFRLVKRLPIASGIGGGSADAAAALRLLARLNGLPLAEPALLRAAARAGADVPVCLESRARIMAGIGERLGPVLRLPKLFALLVNPAVPVETAAVFRTLGLEPGQGAGRGMDLSSRPFETGGRDGLLAGLAASRNDLEPPAQTVAPVLRDLLANLRGLPDCRLARMSGSGATCFALFDDCRASAAAAKVLARAHPGWWIKPTILQ